MDARDRALAYLSARMCSCRQMKDYLLRKGYEEEEITQVIEELKEYRYLDDSRYAAAFMESSLDKGRGMLRIRRELQEKGVDKDIIRQAEEELEDLPDEYDRAFDLAESILGSVDLSAMDYREKEKYKARVARRLSGRGFSPDTVYRVIGRLM